MNTAAGVTINVPMTAEEHYALTAVLRSAVTIGGMQHLRLQCLLERLAQPYKDELMERGLDALASLNRLPALMAMECCPVHISVPLEHQHEGMYSAAKPLDWYEWPRRSA